MSIRTIDLGAEMGDECRYFFSPKEVTGFRDTAQGAAHLKPRGLWYACGDAWLRRVLSAFPEWADSWRYLYRISVTEAVLTLPTSVGVLEFDARYRFEMPPYDTMIDWASVARVFPGIEICPHRPPLERRLKWYRDWDVASGCIWDRDGVEDIRLLARRVGPDAWHIHEG